MARPSKAEERREQILDAFERVILRDGYAKASQRRIADEANVNQPMIHHYFSGGDSLLDALLERVVNRYKAALEQFSATSKDLSLESTLRFVCSDNFHAVSKQNEVFFALIGQGGHRNQVFKKMADVYHEFMKQITCHLQQAGVTNPDEIAYYIMCFVIGHDWAKKLQFGENRNDMVATMLHSLASIE